MRCDQCVSATINGYYCHEHGCPNTNKYWDYDEQQWMVLPIDSDDDLDEAITRYDYEQNFLEGE